MSITPPDNRTATGKVTEVIGAIVDIEFPSDAVPKIFDAVRIDDHDLILEVQQQLGDGVVRTIAMGTTDGLRRNVKARNTGKPIQVPVGKATLGRIMNVLGEPIDNKGPIDTTDRASIHRDPPSYAEQAVSTEVLQTGVKVIDLLCPVVL